MTTYAIGDLQGCLEPLQRLLDRLGFDPAEDRLWFVGDLVNRGPDSVACLRFVRDLGASAVTVLGNHDLHLLAMAAGNQSKASEDLKRVLEAPDAGELLEWLRTLPLIHTDRRSGFTLVHAGLPPWWDVAQATVLAGEVESVLRGPDCESFLRVMYGDTPGLWEETLAGEERLRFIVNALTRLRFVDPDGRMDFNETGPPGSQPEHLVPWFEHPERKSRAERIVFGHWSALGPYAGHNVWALDSGCVWGKALTALKIPEHEAHPNTSTPEEPTRFISVDCPQSVTH
jgi:bis(5'-nucleosyl)-tetraphosphatase (symmetrical)